MAKVKDRFLKIARLIVISESQHWFLHRNTVLDITAKQLDKKKNKSIQIGNKEVKLSFCADVQNDMILYVENPKDSTQKLFK